MNKFAYSPEHTSQHSGGYPKVLMQQSKHKNQVDREQQLNHMFSQFQQDFTFEELIQFLDHWNKVPYDRNIAEQMFQECDQENQRIQARDFINQFIDTERNLNFRINYQQSEMDELVNQRNQLIQNLKQQNMNTNKVILQISNCKNLEPIDRFSSVDSFVQIKLDGINSFATQMLPNNQNPVWNEIFTLDTQANQLEIILIVNDRFRLLKQDEIGRVVINLAELQKKKLIAKEAYLLHGDLRTQQTLQFEAKYVLSEAKLIQEKIKAKEDEIQQMRENMKPNQILLGKLTELFSENKTSHNNLDYSKGNQALNVGGYGVGSGHYELNKSVNMLNLSAYYFPTIKEQKFEQKILEKLEQASFDFTTKTTIIFLIATICLCLIQCFYKPQFMELTILLVFMCLALSGILTHTQHRFISIILIISWFYDVIWLVFLSKDWYAMGGSARNDNGLKTFVIIMSLISTIFAKFPFVVCMWRAYFQFDIFKEQIIKLKNTSLSWNNIGQEQAVQLNSYQVQQQQTPYINNQTSFTMQQQKTQLTPNPSQLRKDYYSQQNPYDTQYQPYQQSAPQGYFVMGQQQQQQLQQAYYSKQQQNEYVYN